MPALVCLPSVSLNSTDGWNTSVSDLKFLSQQKTTCSCDGALVKRYAKWLLTSNDNLGRYADMSGRSMERGNCYYCQYFSNQLGMLERSVGKKFVLHVFSILPYVMNDTRQQITWFVTLWHYSYLQQMLIYPFCKRLLLHPISLICGRGRERTKSILWITEHSSHNCLGNTPVF